MEFRSDINGLRAWAVITVVLYHFGMTGFTGGFIGVDIFFVISGFLMCGIVVTGLERNGNRFSAWNFYLARARRILPALFALNAALLAVGWWTLLPLDYKRLGIHAASSLLFVSNIKFWKESGYFDAVSHEKWLLHTWSLSVEWQFYLLFPLVLMAAWKLAANRKALAYLCIGVFFLSLAACIAITRTHASLAFYLLPTRAWELLAGGLVYFANREFTQKTKILLDLTGFALIIGALVSFNSSTQWPGWKALVPVLGAMLVLLAQRAESFWTSTSIAQWLGTRSYSIYLWHWPVVVALTYLGQKGNLDSTLAGLLLTLVLGHMSYRWVEVPSRRWLIGVSPSLNSIALAVGVVATSTPGLVIYLKTGIPGRFPSAIENIERLSLDQNPRRDECILLKGVESPSCMFGGKTLSAVVLGDSHADAMVSAVTSAATAASTANGVMELTYSACPIIQGVRSSERPQCGAFVDWALRKLDNIPADVPVVIANRHAQFIFGGNENEKYPDSPEVYFSKPYVHAEPEFLKEYSANLTKTICAVAKHHPTYVVRPIPEMGIDVPITVARNMLLGKTQEISIARSEYNQRQAIVWEAQNRASEQCGVKILDPLPYLCSEERCYGEMDNRPIYRDDDHLSESGNKVLVPMFALVFAPHESSLSNGTANR